MKDLLEGLTLQGLARRYHDRCEVYDRAVCTGKSPRSGEPMPVDGYELGLVNRNARQARDDIVRLGMAMGFTEEQIAKAIQDTA